MWPFVLVVACAPAGVAVPVPWVSADPVVARIPLADALLPMTVHNLGTDDALVAVSVDAPFAVVLPQLEVPAGGSADALIAVSPTSYERLRSIVTLRTRYQTATTTVAVAIDDDADRDGAIAAAAGGDDCDDGDADVNRDAVERCNGRDDDCDAQIDDDPVDATLWFEDADGDGFGAASLGPACAAPLGGVRRDGDCNDADDAVFPGASEGYYDGVDQDCGGDSDYDADHDGFDSRDYGGDDCNDGNPGIHPGADDPVDGVDADCDGAP
jgi:hypothetical protein